jgi:hypothetical protein
LDRSHRLLIIKQIEQHIDDDVFAEFSGDKITTKEDITKMDDIMFAEYQRKRNDISDLNHGVKRIHVISAYYDITARYDIFMSTSHTLSIFI